MFQFSLGSLYFKWIYKSVKSYSNSTIGFFDFKQRNGNFDFHVVILFEHRRFLGIRSICNVKPELKFKTNKSGQGTCRDGKIIYGCGVAKLLALCRKV